MVVVAAVVVAVVLAHSGRRGSAVGPGVTGATRPGTTLPPASSSSTLPTTTASPTTTVAPTTTSSPSTTSGFARAGAFAVGTADVTVDYQGVQIPTTVYYPATSAGAGAPAARAGGPFPLVVFSQGFGEPVSAYSGILDGWASAGFVVAGASYPGVAQGVAEGEILSHPADASAVITAMSASPPAGDASLAGLVDAKEVAVAGQSDGGDVSFAVAANTCCHDPRVRAAVILSGAELSSFGGSYTASGSTPVMVVQGSADTVNVPACSAEIYDAVTGPRWYMDVLGASHLSPYLYPGAQRDAVVATTVDFLDAALRDSTPALDAMSSAGNQAGVSTLSSPASVTPSGTYCQGA